MKAIHILLACAIFLPAGAYCNTKKIEPFEIHSPESPSITGMNAFDKRELMTSATEHALSELTPADRGPYTPNITVTHGNKNITNTLTNTNHLVAPPVDSRTENSDNIDNVLLGNTDIHFATPSLERYAKYAAVFWNIIDPMLEDAEILSHGTANALMLYTAYAPVAQKSTFAAYAIQLGLVASAIHKLASFSEKVVKVREQQALEYKHLNEENRKNSLLPLTHPPLINGVEADKNTEIFANAFLEHYFSCCAVFRNILWDQMGVYSILLQSLSYSIVNWASTVSPEKRSSYILLATLLGAAGTLSQAWAKSLSSSTSKMENKATNALSFNRYKRSALATQAQESASMRSSATVPQTPSSPIRLTASEANV